MCVFATDDVSQRTAVEASATGNQVVDDQDVVDIFAHDVDADELTEECMSGLSAALEEVLGRTPTQEELCNYIELLELIMGNVGFGSPNQP